MANYKEKPKKKRETVSRDIALEKMGLESATKATKKQDKIKGRPKGWWAQTCEAILPQKDDDGMEKFRKIFLICAVLAFAAAIGVLGGQLLSINDGVATNSQVQNIAGESQGTVNIDLNYEPFATNSTFATGSTAPPETVETEEVIDVTPVVNTPLNIDFAALKAENPDTRAWVKITGTYVNNVVVQAEDNSYYIDHDFYGNESISGTVFSSYRNKWDGSDDNIVLYGHNMKTGDFFAHVAHYVPNDASREPLAFYKVHPTIMLATPDGGSQTYKIFGAMIANTQSQYGEVFNYVNKTSFKSKDDFHNYIIDIMDRSWFFTDVDLQYGDQLLTLSTCCWPLGDTVETRWVVFARKVRPGESEFVDTTKAERNYNAKLFDYYYELIGGEWYGSNWDRSKLLSYTGE